MPSSPSEGFKGEGEGDDEAWSAAFITAVAVACGAVGILVGLLIACLYRKYTCFRRETDHPHPHPHSLPGVLPSSRAFRCFPVDHEGVNCHQTPNAPVFAIGDHAHPCPDAGQANPAFSSPPSYHAQPPLPAFPHRPSFNPLSQRFSTNSHRHHRLSVDSRENLSDRPTPIESVARISQSDLEPNRLVGTGSAIGTGNGMRIAGTTSHPLSAIVSLSGQPTAAAATLGRQTGGGGRGGGGGQSRNSLSESSDGRRARAIDLHQGDMISLHEFILTGSDPQAFLENAPRLDSPSCLENTDTDNNNNNSSTWNHAQIQPSNSQNQSHDRLQTQPNNVNLNLLPFRSAEIAGRAAEAVAVASAASTSSSTAARVASISSKSPGAFNNLQVDAASKRVASKHIPFPGRSLISLPVSPAHARQEHGDGHDDDDYDDVAACEIECLKIFNAYPDDIKTIFRPIDFSKPMTVRGKKVVYDCKKLDCKGGKLRLDNMGISLDVPAGAIPDGQTTLVTLLLNWDLTDNPPMDRREALVSPVVYCGPHSATFHKPCQLKFRHCAFDNRFAQIMTSETDLFETKDWGEFEATPADESHQQGERSHESCRPLSRRQDVAITVDECQVPVRHFSLYTCILRSKHLHMKKWLQVAVFTHAMTPSLQHQCIRVYFLNKTPCALQWALHTEAEHGYRLACPENTFLFQERGEDLRVKLSYLSDGWNMITKSENGEGASVLFEEVWHGKCPHVCMSFKRSPSAGTATSQLCATTTTTAVVPKPGCLQPEADITTPGQLSSSGDRQGVGPAGSGGGLAGSGVAVTSDSKAEMIICLRLSQLRSENMSTDVHILMFDSVTAKVVFPQGEGEEEGEEREEKEEEGEGEEEETFAMKLG